MNCVTVYVIITERGNQKMAKVKRIQWLDKALDRYHKYDAETNQLLSTKMTEGPYIDVEIVKKQPVPPPIEGITPTKTRKKVNYLSNKELLLEFNKSVEVGRMTDRLAHMLQLLTHRISKKGNFSNYTYIEDMRSYALVMLMTTWDRFKPERSENPFSYYTTCITHSFVQYLNQEKRQRNIRDQIMIKNGMNPSHTYTEEHSSSNTYGNSDENDG